jgi:hypothetical protein
MHVARPARFMQNPFRREQIGGAEALGKSVVDRTEAGNGFGPSTLIAQQAREACRSTQLPEQGLLPARLVQRGPLSLLRLGACSAIARARP